MKLQMTKLFVAAGFAAAASASIAQYATKPVRIISPAPPGGSTDIVSRLIQPGLQEALKQAVIVEARGGAGGYIGSDYVTKQPADGYTLLLGGAFTTITATLQKSPSYSPRRDLIPVAIVATVPNIMIVGPNIKVNNIAEFIAFAKANPGKLNVGSNGVGTTLHLSGELFKLRTGIDMVHIAYKGWADCVTGLLGGQIDLMFDNLSTAMPNVVAGKTRAFAVMSPARHRLLPSVPTFDELGIRNAEVISWFGIMVPAGTPQPIIDTLGRIIRTNAETADFQDKVAKLGMDAAAMGPVESQKFWIGEVDKWEAVVRASQTPLQ